MADTAPVPLVSLFAEVDDPRRPQARLHALEDILLIATLAVICGADSWTEVELFGRPKQVWLETFLALPHGIPSHDTFGRVFARLAPEQREVCFTRWVPSLAASLRDPVVSVDGKAAHRSHDAGRPCIWSAPGRTRRAWSWASTGWTTAPMRSRPSRSCSRCWCWTVAL